MSDSPVNPLVRSASNRSIVCIDLDDSDVTEPSPTSTTTAISTVNTTTTPSGTINSSCIPLPPNQSSSYHAISSAPPSVCSVAASFVRGSVPNPPLIRQVPDYVHSSRAPYYPNVYAAQQHSGPAYFGMYQPPPQYNSIPPELNTYVIEEEIRNLVANIHQSPTFRGFS